MSRSCIILAGGKSVRLGYDKIQEKVGGSSLLDKVIFQIEPLADEIILVVAEDRNFPRLEDHQKIRKVCDIFPGQGSLGGIYTGLMASNSFYNLVIAADMPFLNQALLRYILEVSNGFDFVLPRINTFFEPLHAVYSKNCIKPAESIIRQGRKVITELFNHVRVRYVEAEEIDRFDPKHLSFFNINTKEDLERARKIAGEGRLDAIR
jgi:molybdopterin-guanine dinucleotide biosynthesis protein A